MTLQQQRLEAALGLAEVGYDIVPIPEGQKAPSLPQWQHLASRNPETVRGWLGAGGQYGAMPQAGSRLLVVDVDRPEELADFPPLPPTLIVDTTNGRFHIYAHLPDGVEEADVPRTFAGGEVRIAGSGQVVGPWSVHPSGSVYIPRNGAEVRELSPDWLAALERSHEARTAAQRAAQGPQDAGWAIPEPGRHDFLLSKGRNLRGIGLSGERLLAELLRLNAERCQPSKAEEEVRAIASWVEANITDDPPPPHWAPDAKAVGSEEAPASLPFLTPAQVAAIASPETEWIVPGFVAVGAITEIDGKIKAAGKTTLALHIARAVLEGSPFLEQPTLPSQVLFVTEQSRQTFVDALRLAGMTATGSEMLILFREDFRGARWAEVVAACQAQDGHRLVIFDTVGKLAAIREENSAGEWAAAMSPLQDLAAAGRAVIVCRHDRKGGGEVGDSGRGSSQASGDVDIILAVRRPEGNQPGNRRVIETLSRFRETPDKIVIELREEGYALLGTDEAVQTAAAVAFVLDSIRPLGSENGTKQIAWVERPELVEHAKAAGISHRALDQALARLLQEGQVQRRGEGKRGDPYAFAPAEFSDSSRTQTVRDETKSELNLAPLNAQVFSKEKVPT